MAICYLKQDGSSYDKCPIFASFKMKSLLTFNWYLLLVLMKVSLYFGFISRLSILIHRCCFISTPRNILTYITSCYSTTSVI